MVEVPTAVEVSVAEQVTPAQPEEDRSHVFSLEQPESAHHTNLLVKAGIITTGLLATGALVYKANKDLLQPYRERRNTAVRLQSIYEAAQQ